MMTEREFMKRIFVVLVSTTLLAGAACDKKAEQPDEDPAAAAQEAEAKDQPEEAEEPEEDPLPEAVRAIDCSAKPGGDGLEVSDKSGEDGASSDDGDAVDQTLPEDSPLLDPEGADEQAPSVFWANVETTQGPVVIRFERDWSPTGVDRVYNLIKMGYYEDIAFFRVIDGFMAQFGIHGNPKVNEAWKEASIKDDPVEKSNERGMVTFAKRAQPDTRTVQLFINYADNARLNSSGFAPIGEVEKCMENVDELHGGYGEGAPRGQGPSQKRLTEEGNEYLRAKFPKLDYILETSILAKQ